MTNGRSKHRDILDQLKADILDGKYGDGKPLPSAFALMKKFGVARATAVAALKALEREGLAESRRGSGTYPVKREPITFGVIVLEAECPFYSRVCEGISEFANNSGGESTIIFDYFFAAAQPNTGGLLLKARRPVGHPAARRMSLFSHFR